MLMVFSASCDNAAFWERPRSVLGMHRRPHYASPWPLVDKCFSSPHSNRLASNSEAVTYLPIIDDQRGLDTYNNGSD